MPRDLERPETWVSAWTCKDCALGRRDSEEKNKLTLCRDFGKLGGSIARIAQLVERNLAKVEVAGSNPVSRSSLPESPCFKLPHEFPGFPGIRQVYFQTWAMTPDLLNPEELDGEPS